MHFNFSREEVESFSESEQQLLSYSLASDTFTSWGVSSRELQKCYEILGCSPVSSDSELRGAYRNLVMKYHPDRLTAAEQTPKHHRCFRAIQDAYEAVTKSRSPK